MNLEALPSLSARQAECLRLVAKDRDAKEIGRLLGISDETVERHIKLAMKKLDSNSRFNAARALADYEGRDHPVVMPTSGSETGLRQSRSGAAAAGFGRDEPLVRELREERTRFDLSEPLLGVRTVQSMADRNDLGIGLRLLLCVVAFLALAVGLAGIGSAMGQLSGWVHHRALTKKEQVRGPNLGSTHVEQDARSGSSRRNRL